jgi:hypothetical protein
MPKVKPIRCDLRHIKRQSRFRKRLVFRTTHRHQSRNRSHRDISHNRPTRT